MRLLARSARALAGVVAALLAATVVAASAHGEEVAILVETSPTPGAPLPVVVRTDAAGPVELTLLRLGADHAAVRDGRIALTDEQMAWIADDPMARQEAAGSPRFAFLQLVAAEVVDRRTVTATAKERVAVTFRPNSPGVHIVAARFGRARAFAPALVTALGLIVKRHAEGTTVWCVDRRTGLPWRDARVKRVGDDAPNVADRHGLVRIVGATEGPVRIEAHVLDGGEGGGRRVHRAFGTTEWHPALVAGRRVHLSTHQPASRPGEEVGIRGIVRSAGPAGLVLDPTARQAIVRIEDPSGARLGEAVAPIAPETGTFAALITLPPTATTGMGRVIATIDGQEHAGPIRIEAYRRPAFEVVVRPGVTRARPSTQVRFDAAAAWINGGALKGAPIAWIATHTRIAPEPFPERDLVRLFFGSERDVARATTVAEGRGRLDADGRFAIDVDLSAEIEDGFLALAAIVEGPGGIHVTGRASLAVRATPWRLALRTDRRVYAPEDQPRVEVRLDAADEGAAEGRDVVLTLARIADDGAEVWATPTTIRLDRDGRGEATIALGGEGRYRLLASVVASDGAGPSASVELDALAVRVTRGLPAPALTVVADRDAYAPGETARILLRAPAEVPSALVSIEGERLLDARVVALVDGTARVDIPLDASHAPNVYVAISTVEGGEAKSVVRMLRVPSSAPLLDVRVAPDVSVARPGASVGFTIDVRDDHGAPVGGADVAVSIIDDALHNLFTNPAATLARFFHAPRRNEVGTDAPFHVAATGRGVVRELAVEKRARTGGYGGPGSRAPSPPSAAPAPRSDAGTAGSPDEAARDESEEAPLFGEDVSEEVLQGSGGGGPTAELRDHAGSVEAKKGEGAAAVLVAEVRRSFLASIHWSPRLVTDSDGRARIEAVRLADDLTRWRATADAIDARTRVGRGEAVVRTELPFEVRLTLPRFLREGDETLAAIHLRNRSEGSLGGIAMQALRDGEPLPIAPALPTSLPAGAVHAGSARWDAGQPGSRTLLVRAAARDAAGDEVGDAEERTLDVHPRGIARVVASVATAEEGRALVHARVPADAVPGTWRGRVLVQPGLRHAVEDALPYLVDYPHGCTEQTMSRFVPLVVALGSPWPGAGDPHTGERAIRERLDRGIAHLATLRHKDGGFGWWPTDASSAEMTALVADGLQRLAILVSNDPRVVDLLAGAIDWLATEVARPNDVEAGTAATTPSLALLALARAGRLERTTLDAAIAAWERAGAARDPLRTAILLRAANAAGRTDAAARLAAHLDDAARREANGRVRWGAEDGPVDRYERDPIHATAEAALALLESGGDRALVRGAARWLLDSRRGGTRWESTRDTAAAVRFLVELAVREGDAGTVGQVTIASEDVPLAVLGAAGVALKTDLDPARLEPGAEISIDATGAGDAIYDLVVVLEGVEAGDALDAIDAGLRLERTFWIVEPVTTAEGVAWRRRPLEESVEVGTLVESEIVVSSPVDRRYLMLTEPRVAGFEPDGLAGIEVAGVASVTPTERDVRDDRTHDWRTALGSGERLLVRHRFRATHVGRYRALPPHAELMYYPDVTGRGRGEVIEVRPRAEEGR